MMAPADNRSTAPIPEFHAVQDFHGLLCFHIDDELLEQGDERIIEPGDHALDHQWEMTPLMREIARRLFDQNYTAIKQIIISHGFLTIHYWERDNFNRGFYERLIRDGAFAVAAMDHLGTEDD